MYINANRNSQPNKNTYNLELNVLCTMDMDALEITKTNSIRKYEENAYLLGNIFSIEEQKNNNNNDNNNNNNNINNNNNNNDNNNDNNNNNKNNENNNNNNNIKDNNNIDNNKDNNNDNNKDNNNNDSNNINNNNTNSDNNDIDIDINKSPNTNDNKMDLDIDLDFAENDLLSSSEYSINTSSSIQNTLKKEILNLFDYKIDGDEDMDVEEHLQRLIRKCNNEKNNINEEILNEINNLYSEYKKEENLLNKKKKEFNEHNKQYENIITNLRGIKNQIDEKIIEDLTNQADNINVLPNTYKESRYYEIKEVDKIDKEYPFNENSKIILCPL